MVTNQQWSADEIEDLRRTVDGLRGDIEKLKAENQLLRDEKAGVIRGLGYAEALKKVNDLEEE
jgi:hypothetical protein